MKCVDEIMKGENHVRNFLKRLQVQESASPLTFFVLFLQKLLVLIFSTLVSFKLSDVINLR